MSLRYKGAVISATPPTTSTSSASGAWTLEQQMQAQGAGTWPFGGPFNYIEDVFSTYLYTGNGSTQTITNGIDLAGKGGMVWGKGRSVAYSHHLYDTNRGAGYRLLSNTTDAQAYSASLFLTSFNSDGFSLGSGQALNESAATYASWTFRKQPKFFDVVTFTYTGSSQTVSHSLASVPGAIIMKRTDAVEDWCGWFVIPGAGNGYTMSLNTTAASTTTIPTSNFTSTTFKPGVVYGANAGGTVVPTVGGTYVAYLFASNAGGFGLTGTDNVISCGSYTGTSTVGNEINVGFEPQFIIIKRATGTAEHWQMFDNMRGIATGGNDAVLYPSLSNAEYAAANAIGLTATGFKIEGSGLNVSGDTYIYIAIRRGPMKVPTSGTKVFTPVKATFSGTTVTDTGYVVDMVINKTGVATGDNNFVLDRLRGSNNSTGQITLPSTSSTSAEVASAGRTAFTGSVTIQNGFLQQDTTANNIVWAFGRAPSFFDEVCWTATGSTVTQAHNLGVVPELVITKIRNGGSQWYVNYNFGASTAGEMYLSLTNAGGSYAYSSLAVTAQPTATQLQFASGFTAGQTMVTYLFASCPGVSKVGSYTGNGSTQTINCGFTGGARFVLIKRTDAVGDWYVYDTARGMTTLTDPYLLLNSTAAESATLGSVTTVTTGFALNAGILAAINTNAASYIYLAIA